MSLQARTIIVTGVASGIGQAVALQLAREGARLALVDVDAEGGRETCDDIRRRFPKVDLAYATLDVTKEDDVGKLVRSFSKTFKCIHGLVNCAGIYRPTTTEVPSSEFAKVMQVNVDGTVYFCTSYIKEILKYDQTSDAPDGGYAIVNIGSNAILRSLRDSAAYNASKHAVLGYSRSIAKDYARLGLRVNCVGAGPTHSRILRDAPNSDELESVVDTIPMGRMAQPDEIANVILFLLSPKASFVTGALWPVDGGSTC